MSGPAFHPSETTLLDLARGAIKPGARLVVLSHLERCPSCRADLAALEAAAGHLVEETAPVALDPHALDLALARIERPAPQPALPPARLPSLLRDLAVPRALAGVAIGPTRWMAPGMTLARVHAQAPNERVYLLRVGPGLKLPHHGHTGCELTTVLHGAFSDENGLYRAGDFTETTSENTHHPKVEGEQACVCLIASDGPMRMLEAIPRLLQPFFGV